MAQDRIPTQGEQPNAAASAVGPLGRIRGQLGHMAAALRARRDRLGRRRADGPDHDEMVDCAEMPAISAGAAASAPAAARAVRMSENQRRAQEHFNTAFSSTEQAWNKTSMLGIANPLRLENVKKALGGRDPQEIANLIIQVMGPVVGTKASNSFSEVNARHAQALQVVIKTGCEVVFTGRHATEAGVKNDAGVRRMKDLLLRWVQFGQLAGVGATAEVLLTLPAARSSSDELVVLRATRRLARLSLTIAGKHELAERAFSEQDTDRRTDVPAANALPRAEADLLTADQQVTLRMAMVAPVLPALASVGVVARISDELMSNIVRNAPAWNEWRDGGAEKASPESAAATGAKGWPAQKEG